MPRFTLELNEAIELAPDGDIGLNEYPIFDENYREGLNKKIIEHYYFYEIGHETISKFRFAMRVKMSEVMPLFNQLYRSELIKYDPLRTVDIKTLSKGVSTAESTDIATSKSESVSESNSRAVNSETPQTMLRGDEDYATSAADSTGESDVLASSNSENTNNGVTSQDNESSTTGYQGVASELVMRYRESMLNIDIMVIDSVKDLFMLIWSTHDSYTN